MDLFRKPLDPVIALSAIAVLDIFLFLIVGAWTVGGGETMMTGLIAQFFLGEAIDRIPFWHEEFKPDAGYWKIYISLGMLFGAIVGAVASKEFFWRFPKRLSEWVMISPPDKTPALLTSTCSWPPVACAKVDTASLIDVLSRTSQKPAIACSNSGYDSNSSQRAALTSNKPT